MATRNLKVLLIGAPNVGKSTLLHVFMTGTFTEEYRATIGVDVISTTISFPEGNVKIAIFDIGGQSGFDELRTHYCRNAHYIIFVYDVSDSQTLEEVSKWYEFLSRKIFVPQNQFIRGMIVANKSDLLEGRHDVLTRGEKMAALLALDFMKTSAKTGENVAEMFVRAASEARHAIVPTEHII